MDIQLSYTELRKKDVVNMVDGRRLGHIIDIVFDVKGRIIGLVTPGFRRMLFFKATDDIFVPWCDIKKIGDDVILVELRPKRISPKEKCAPPPPQHQPDFCCDCGHCEQCTDGSYSDTYGGYRSPSGGGSGSADEGIYYSSKSAQNTAYAGSTRPSKQQNPKYYYTSGEMYD